MAPDHSLNTLVEAVASALADYARSRGASLEEFHVYARLSRDWGKAHVMVVSDLFNGKGGFESYVDVRRYLEDRFRDEPTLLHHMGLVVRSSDQVRSGGIYEIGEDYQEVRPHPSGSAT